MGLPGTFKFTQKGNPKKSSAITERIIIEYSVEVYIELPQGQNAQPVRMSHKTEVDVREYLFTDEEVEDDWNNY